MLTQMNKTAIGVAVLGEEGTRGAGLPYVGQSKFLRLDNQGTWTLIP